MFKAFVSKSHPEFSSNRQQDAQEFFLHLVNLVEVSLASIHWGSQKYNKLLWQWRDQMPSSLHLSRSLGLLVAVSAVHT